MRVLLIDDTPDIRAIGRVSLETVGKFETHLAASGREGIELAQKIRPDVILLDAVMPELDGLQTLAELLAIEALAGVPVVFLTGRTDPADVRRYLDRGAVGVIGKPFDPLTLAAELSALLAASSR